MIARQTITCRLGPAAHLAAAACCLLLTACAASPNRHGLDYDPSLITGERLFDAPIPAEELPVEPILEMSPAMRDYMNHAVQPRGRPAARFKSLFASLTRDGYFETVYTADRTLTAADTFAAKGGNCLSYTNLFVTLAREAGLDARYQIVDVPPTWDADSGFLIRYTHINVLLKGMRLEDDDRDDVVVDFNLVHPKPDYRHREVSDQYAESLFYGNRSVALLREGRIRESFAYLRRALELAPENQDLWTNLGAFYAKAEDPHSAIEAYRVALALDPDNKAAFVGLAQGYAGVGDTAKAAAYQEKVRRYRDGNPYYQFALAQSAFEQADLPRSLELVNAAIELEHNAEFYLLKSLVELKMNDEEAAEMSLEQARRAGLERRVKMDMLRSLAAAGAI